MATTATRTKTTAKAANSAAANIEEQIRKIREDITGLGSAIAKFGSSKAGQYQAEAEGAVNDAAERSREALDAANRELSRLEKQLAGRIRRNPVSAVGIAAGIGFIVALLMRR